MKFLNLFLFIFLFLTSINTFSQIPPANCGPGDPNGKYGKPDSTTVIDPETGDTIRIPVVVPKDPNEIIGPKGYDSTIKWVSVNDNLGYKILFENDPDFATAPAQKVIIYMPLHPKLNPNSIRIGDFGFGTFTFTVPANTTTYTKRLDVRDSLGVMLDVTAGLDLANRRAFWVMQSIDPSTGLASTLPANAGFLPVNDSSKGNGEGYVTLNIQPLSSAKTRDTISATASIVFDINDPLATNVETNTIDAVAPTSKINKLNIDQNTYTLNWTGQDDANGSGIRDYAIYYAEAGGPFKLLENKITGLTTSFIATPGTKYCFYSVATDNTGNVENQNKTCEVSTDLTLPVTWLYFNGHQQGNDVFLTWATATEKNTKEFIIERSLDGKDFKSVGTISAKGNSSQTNNYNYLDVDAILLQAKVIFYRLKQIDLDGNSTYSSVVAIPLTQANNQLIVKAYPNPFDQSITLQVLNNGATSDNTIVTSLYTLDGKLLYQKSITNQTNSTVLLNNLPNMAPGVYILKTVIDNKVYPIKMIRK